MIIVLKGADFSASNIGTLSTWRVTRSLGTGADYVGPTSVDKGTAFNATITIAEGYELGASGVTVTMGGQILSSGVTINGNTITISIASVTGNVTIKVPTVNLSTGEEDVGGNTGSGSGDAGGDLGDPSITYLLNLNFNTTPVANMSDVIVIDLPDSSIPLQQTSEGIVNNGANPYGFALVNPIKIPDNWRLEYCVKFPEFAGTGDTGATGDVVINPASYGVLGADNSNTGGTSPGPCVLSDSSMLQVRYNSGAPRVSSDGGYNLLDNEFHTYRLEGKPDRSVDFYRDNQFIYNRPLAQGSVSTTASWGRVLGLHKQYADAMNTGAYKTDGNGIVKYIRLWEGTN
jgi:hypothetical protein